MPYFCYPRHCKACALSPMKQCFLSWKLQRVASFATHHVTSSSHSLCACDANMKQPHNIDNNADVFRFESWQQAWQACCIHHIDLVFTGVHSAQRWYLSSTTSYTSLITTNKTQTFTQASFAILVTHASVSQIVSWLVQARM